MALAALVLIASVAALVLLSRGAITSTPSASKHRPSAPYTPLPTPTPAGTRTVLVEVSTPPNLVGPQTVHWVGLDGTEVATRPLNVDQAMLGAGGTHVLVYRTDGHVLELRPDGSESDVGQGMPATTARGATSLPVRAEVSPDGTQWIWGEITSNLPTGNGGVRVTSHIVLGGMNATPRHVATAIENDHSLRPYRWTLANPLIAHGANGVGGYLLFSTTFGQTDELNLEAGAEKPIGPPEDSAVDIASNGAIAYTSGQFGARMLTINGPGLKGLSAPIPGTRQAGGVMFDPSATHLVYCTSPGANPGNEHFETDLMNLKTGYHSAFGPANLQPATWLPDGRLVEFSLGPTDGPAAGTYLIATDGAARQLSTYTDVVGVVQLPQ
jgi:hypothetical protein